MDTHAVRIVCRRDRRPLGLVIAIGLLTGCQAGPAPVDEPMVAAPPGGSSSPPASIDTAPPGPDDYAAAASRDVEAVLEHTGRGQGEDTPARPRPVHWTGEPAPPAVAMDSPETDIAPPVFRVDETVDEPRVPDLPVEAGGQDTAGTLHADRVGELMTALTRELVREASYASTPLPDLLAASAQSLSRPDRGVDGSILPGLDEDQAAVLTAFQTFFAEVGRQLDSGAAPKEVLPAQLDRLRESITQPQPLTITTAELCFRVAGYGDFSPFDRSAFMAHESQQVIVYMEIGGFSSRREDQGQWVTELSQQLTIYSHADGIPVWTDDWQPAIDRTKNRRQDFFTVQMLTMPKALSVGRYHLKARVRDEATGAEAETSIEFEMVADAKLAARVP